MSTFEDFKTIFLFLLMVIGLKSLMFGQYWPWQYRDKCPHCGAKKEIK